MREKKPVENRGFGRGIEKGSCLSVSYVPPGITSLRCFGTDDIAGPERRYGSWDDVINSQSGDAGTGRVWPAPGLN